VIRLIVVSGLLFWCGTTLVLAELRWFRREPLVDRLRPYNPALLDPARSGTMMSVASFRDVIGPIAMRGGTRLARLFGVSEELSLRLHRIHSSLDVQAFRVRQLGWSVAAFALIAATSIALGLPALLTLAAVAGAPLLAFLTTEQQLAKASRSWQQRLFLELPVVSEQLGMLLAAGFSLSGALDRIATRTQGAAATDLQVVTQRIRQGLSDIDALREWAAIARVDAVDRLVGVLALNQEAADLGKLISEEARAIRRDVQRQLIETIERRSQQVWIPVTVATLVPGALFLAVPFIEAMSFFTNG